MHFSKYLQVVWKNHGGWGKSRLRKEKATTATKKLMMFGKTMLAVTGQ